MKKNNIEEQFIKYVSQNVLGMIGISVYILADTYFISSAVGADGITALNLVLPVYNLIYAMGAMIGVGSAIKYSIDQSKGNYFVNAIFWGTIVGIIFLFVGLLMPDRVMEFMGADAGIVSVGKNYTRIFMSFAPFFIWNHIVNAFVRNDGDPSIAMLATLVSSLFNIVFDYVLMFQCKMGMEGAALATALSPLIGVFVCCVHFRSNRNNVSFELKIPSIKKMIDSCTVGVSAFVGEISSGVITVVFNMLIMNIAGNTGVAAYGIVANISLVAVAIFNGIALGSQPLLSNFYGQGDSSAVKRTSKLAIVTALSASIFIIGAVWLGANEITDVFNRDGDEQLTIYAVTGLKIYFLGFVFAGINIVCSTVFSAIENARVAFVISVARGFVLIVGCAFIMSVLFGVNGVFGAFPVAELITFFIVCVGLKRNL